MRKFVNKKLLITGGHLTPAQAVVGALKTKGYKNIYWIGHKYTMEGDKNLSAEYNVVTKDLKLKFYELRTGKLFRKWTLSNLTEGISNLIRIPLGFIKAIILVRELKPDIIVSFGGYLAVPVVLAGKLLGIRIVTHEQTIVTGLANKIIAKFAEKIFISWEESKKFFKSSKTIFTGNPYRKDIEKINTNNYIFDNNRPIIYITGGNQGAHIINLVVARLLPELLKKFNIIHQCGSTTVTNDYLTLNKFKKSLKKELQNRYVIKDYIYGDEIGEVFDKCDLIISRSGANTCTDLLVIGKLAILIPIPWSAYDEQYKNAVYLRDLGLARILIQKDLSKKTLTNEINVAIDHIKQKKDFNHNPLITLQKRMRQYVNPKAANMIVSEIEKVFKK